MDSSECGEPGTVPVGPACQPGRFTFDDELRATFDFGGRIGSDSYPSVSLAQQEKFKSDFKNQLASVRRQLASYKDKDGNLWVPEDAALPPRITSGQYRPRSDFHVIVSEAYRRSESLLPSWLGRRGWMEFPAQRVATREASIAHELTHLLFPNGNRMLDEGLSSYLQYKLFPELQVWPNFGTHPNVLVADLLQTYGDVASQVKALWSMDLDGFEAISTPDDLSLRVGSSAPIGGSTNQEKEVYGVAASIVGFLLDNVLMYDLLTEENFGSLYKSTPLRPFERNSGEPERWQEFYRKGDISYSFDDITLLWKTFMHFGCFTQAGGLGLPDFLRKPPLRLNDRQMQLVLECYDKVTGLMGYQAPAPQAPGKV